MLLLLEWRETPEEYFSSKQTYNHLSLSLFHEIGTWFFYISHMLRSVDMTIIKIYFAQFSSHYSVFMASLHLHYINLIYTLQCQNEPRKVYLS